MWFIAALQTGSSKTSPDVYVDTKKKNILNFILFKGLEKLRTTVGRDIFLFCLYSVLQQMPGESDAGDECGHQGASQRRRRWRLPDLVFVQL